MPVLSPWLWGRDWACLLPEPGTEQALSHQDGVQGCLLKRSAAGGFQLICRFHSPACKSQAINKEVGVCLMMGGRGRGGRFRPLSTAGHSPFPNHWLGEKWQTFLRDAHPGGPSWHTGPGDVLTARGTSTLPQHMALTASSGSSPGLG